MPVGTATPPRSPGTATAAFGIAAMAIAAAAAQIAGAGFVAAQQTGASRFALAQVSDPRGRAFVDIGPDDFVVQEAGATREILDVRVADYPVVVVLDNGNAARSGFDEMRGAVSRFVERLGSRPLALITTAGAPAIVASFEDERSDFVSKLQSIEAADDEGEPLRGAALAAETIRATGALFSTVVVAAARSPEPPQSEIEPLIGSIIDSRAVVHVVSNAGVAGSPQRLRRIANETHGEFTTIYSPASYQPALDRLATRLTTELLIEYIVPVGSRAADVQIGVRIPGARVRGLGVAPR